MRVSILTFCLALALLGCESPTLEMGQVSIIPLPNSIEHSEGSFTWNSKTTIAVENEAQEKIAQIFAGYFEKASPWKPSVQVSREGQVLLSSDPTLAEEAYVLEVKPDQIQIKAASGAGFFYAFQSLRQLFPPSFSGPESVENKNWGLPTVTIEDVPAFGWRGFMLDVSRHFFDKEEVKAVLDIVASLKMNRFHWHLADDQGWRVEIKKYPKLTEIGAWRMDHKNTDETISDWWGRPVQKPGDQPTYGGFYTQEDIKEIVTYAKERHIEVVPEIDMPGHAQATIAAYPEIGCVNALPYVATGGVFKNNTYNPGKEETFEFVENMLNEIMDLFPFEYVHIGGDECNKEQWKIDPDAQRRMREEGLKNEEELQSYFIKRVEKMINNRDRIMIGWDEILEGGLAPNATVMSWRGEEGGIASAKAGHEVIMTPSKYCYLDLKQGHDDLEPNLGYSRMLLSWAYNYKLIPESFTEEEAKYIIGTQANLWTESITDWGKLTYMTFPRVYAVAENGWTSEEEQDWDNFTDRLFTQFERLDAQNIRYAVSALSPWINHEAKEDGIEISFTTEFNNLDIYYTLDGSEPNQKANKYEGPFLITESAKLAAQAYKGEEAVGYLSKMEFPIHKAAGQLKGAANLEKFTDQNYAALSVGDDNWAQFPLGESLEISFDEPVELSSIAFNSLRFTISGYYPPEYITVFSSRDGENFGVLAELDQKDKAYVQGRNKIRSSLRFDPIEVKTLRIQAKEINPLPAGHHLAGQRAKIKIDEIVVK